MEPSSENGDFLVDEKTENLWLGTTKRGSFFSKKNNMYTTSTQSIPDNSAIVTTFFKGFSVVTCKGKGCKGDQLTNPIWDKKVTTWITGGVGQSYYNSYRGPGHFRFPDPFRHHLGWPKPGGFLRSAYKLPKLPKWWSKTPPPQKTSPHIIHEWYIYQLLAYSCSKCIGKYIPYMDSIGQGWQQPTRRHPWVPVLPILSENRQWNLLSNFLMIFPDRHTGFSVIHGLYHQTLKVSKMDNGGMKTNISL